MGNNKTSTIRINKCITNSMEKVRSSQNTHRKLNIYSISVYHVVVFAVRESVLSAMCACHAQGKKMTG